MSYYDDLKHPKWQKKRLEVLDRAGFECDNCGDNESTLHVHHGYYEKGLKPWEYPIESLHCLCEDCHNEVTSVNDSLKKHLGTLDLCDLWEVLGYAHGKTIKYFPDIEIDASNTSFFTGICNAFNVQYDRAIDFIKATRSHGIILVNQLEELFIRKNQ